MTANPSKLKAGDLVRLVSPASTPDRDGVLCRAALLETWGLTVDFGRHLFEIQGYMAGTDEQRLCDLNTAICDPGVRAIFATRGGKGSYRIADRLNFDALCSDPKFIIGFSDITMLHLSANRHGGLVGIHGALVTDGAGGFDAINCKALHAALMVPGYATVSSRPDEPTAALSTSGRASGRLIGGNLDMVATAAGWALPNLDGAILLLEAIGRPLGQVDRQLTMLRKGGHLDGVTGVAVGQFTGFNLQRDFTIIDLLRDHLDGLGVPVLGGLPLGHGDQPLVVPIGATAVLDADTGTLSFPQ